MIAKHLLRWSFVACLGLIAGCGSTKGIGLPWVPQGPGESPEAARERRQAEARGQPAPAPAPAASASASSAPEPAPARRMDVAPDLIAQRPPPPRSPAEQAAAAAAAAASGPQAYTQATKYGDLVFVSGQIALDFGTNQMLGATVEEQTRQAMENTRLILESHRLTLANVVSVTVYMTNIADFRAMNAVYESYFRGALPARSVVEVARLPRGALVEVSTVAGR